MALRFSPKGKRSPLVPVEQHKPLPFSQRAECLLGQEMFKVLDRARKIEESGVHINHLELGNPRLAPPPDIIAMTIKALQSLNVGYTSSAGHPDLRLALAERYTKTAGRRVEIENVVVSTANLLISQFLDLTCDRGDRVVLFTPTFPS
ncbi:MAG: aminotransferase class I/II-fold pyridoxal phosphate-dependent enzyme, partial [Nitrospirales bacterium]